MRRRVDLAKKWSYLDRDFVKEVTAPKAYDWDPKSKLSRKWTLIQGKRPARFAKPLTGEDYLEKLPPVKYRIVAYDYGLKIEYSAPSAAAWFSGARPARDGHGRRGAGERSGWHLPLQRAGRSGQ